MFSRILIANRGEIAVRVIRTCRRMGIETVAVYSEADEDSLHVRLADESIKIGPSESAKSYLNISSIISAAEIADVDAIHPGYGFLSENYHFAEVCRSCKIEFIGPSAKAMELLGNKVKAKETEKSAGVPIIPGSSGGVLKSGQTAVRIPGYQVNVRHGLLNEIQMGQQESIVPIGLKPNRDNPSAQDVVLFADQPVGDVGNDQFLVNNEQTIEQDSNDGNGPKQTIEADTGT